jgi:hypothetical protein
LAGPAANRLAPRLAALILILGFGLMLGLNAPGQLTYDSLTQLAQGRAGHYNSWHPPLMAWLLGLFDALVPGTLLFLLFQTLLLLAGLLALLALKPRGWLSAGLALLVVATPQWLLYQGEIWKDVLFADAGIAGFAGLAWHLRRPHPAWFTAALLLLVLAAAMRQNGILLLLVAAACLAIAQPRRHQGLIFLGAGLALLGGLYLALASRTDGGEGAAAQVRLAQGYDMAGAFQRAPQLSLPLTPALDGALRRGAKLYTPLANDPFAADPAVDQALSNAPDGAVFRGWRALVLGHPRLYLSVRWADFTALLTTPDPAACHFAPTGLDGPPELLRTLHLAARHRAQDKALASYAAAFFPTPVFSHLAWGLVAVGLLALLFWRRRDPADLAVAGLLAAALLFSFSFFFISIACDYRYLLFLDLAAMAGSLYAVARR